VEERRNRQREETAPGELAEDKDEAGGKSGHAGILPVAADARQSAESVRSETELLAQPYHSVK
jgi:hypothetical protein